MQNAVRMLFSVVLAFVMTAPMAAQAAPSLLVPPPKSAQEMLPPLKPGVVRQRRVAVDTSMLDAKKAVLPLTVAVELFDGNAISLVLTVVKNVGDGDSHWRGYVAEYPMSEVSITLNGNYSFGRIRIFDPAFKGGTYIIGTTGNNSSTLLMEISAGFREARKHSPIVYRPPTVDATGFVALVRLRGGRDPLGQAMHGWSGEE